MASLKELKVRIGSVKSTQKITKAMQMVAAAKLRRAQEAAVAARPYADPALEGFRPRPRPEGLGPATAADDAALAIPTAQRTLQPRTFTITWESILPTPLV